MASTYSYQDAINLLSTSTPKIHESSVAAIAVNLATEIIWDAYTWRSTLAELPPFWLVENKQDYGSPVGAVPADFRSLHKAWIVDTSSYPYDRLPLRIYRDVEKTSRMDNTLGIGYIPETNSFRIHPNVPYGYGGTRFLIDGSYKKNPTKITPATFSTPIPWEDRHFHVFITALKWAMMPEGQEKYQNYQVLMFLVDEMAVKEGLLDGSPSGVAPAESLV